MSAIEKIFAGFPNKEIPPIVSLPVHKKLKAIHFILSSNVASVHSNRGNGALEHLALTVTATTYQTVEGVAFVSPLNPGANVHIPADSSGPQISALEQTHNVAKQEFDTFTNVDGALTQQLLECIDPMYYRGLRNRYTGYASLTTRQLLEHLCAQYGEITPADLQANEDGMKQSYDANMPIEVLFDQIEDGTEFAENTIDPYTATQILRIAYNLVYETGQFNLEYDKWTEKAPNEKNVGKL